MNYSCIIFGLIFVGLGIAFALGKLYVRMIAWKTMTEEEKAGIRIEALCRNIGGMIALCGLIFLAGGFWSAFKAHAFVLSMAAWMVLCIADVIFIDKSGRYIG